MSQKNRMRAWHAVVGMFSLLLAIVLLAVARNSDTPNNVTLFITLTIAALFLTSLYHIITSIER